MKLTAVVASSLLAVTCMAAPAAHADTYAWTMWNYTNYTAGNQGTAYGTIGGVNVTYSGQLNGVNFDDNDGNNGNTWGWNPTSTYAGGQVSNAPGFYGLSVQMNGGLSETETITFSSAVTDPALAIFSLGSLATSPASFVFTGDGSFSIVAGGPNAHYGGSSLYLSSPDTVSGVEGNGTIVFDGTYTSISFTTPVAEDYYAITVGYDTHPSTASENAPEPGTLSLIGLGLGALPILRRRFLRK